MKLIRLSMKNIRSYKEQEIFFPRGSTLLVGEIGSGKSSILLALEYALFGLQPGQKGSALLRNNAEYGEVMLELEVEGNLVMIERRLKKTSKGVSNEYSSISINGEKFESAVTEVKSRIIDLLGYPPELVKKNNSLYRYTVHSPQEQMKQIVTEDSEIRLNLLRNIFGIEKYRQIKDNLAILLQEMKSEYKIYDSESKGTDEIIQKISELEKNRDSLTDKISIQESELKLRISERKKHEDDILQIKNKIDELRELRKEAEKTNIHIGTKTDGINIAEKELLELQKIMDESRGAFIQEDYEKLKKEIDEEKSFLSSLNRELITLSANYAHASTRIEESSRKKDRIFSIEVCPTCLQDVSEFHKHNILNETERTISESKRSLLELAHSREEKLTEILSRNKKIESLESRIIQFEINKSKFLQLEKIAEKISKLEKEKKSLEQDVVLLEKHLAGLKEKMLQNSAAEFLFNKKDSELKQAFLSEKRVEIALAELKKELELSAKEKEIYNKILLKKEESKNKAQSTLELIDWLSNKFSSLIDAIERNILVNLRYEFSRFFSKWFSMLVSDESLIAQVDETFTPIILSGEHEMEYSFLSGGERTAVALAYRLALNQTINSLLSRIKTKGILILDEPTEGFSETQINKMRDVLAELKTEQMIIVSHEQKIEGFVDNIIRIKKEGTTSEIQADQKT